LGMGIFFSLYGRQQKSAVKKLLGNGYGQKHCVSRYKKGILRISDSFNSVT
jgi:hypothetical protein